MPRAFMMQYKKQKRVKVIFHEDESDVASLSQDKQTDHSEQMQAHEQSRASQREAPVRRTDDGNTSVPADHADRDSPTYDSPDSGRFAIFKSSRDSAFRKVADSEKLFSPIGSDRDRNDKEIQECDSTTQRAVERVDAKGKSPINHCSPQKRRNSSQNSINHEPQPIFGSPYIPEKYSPLSHQSIFGIYPSNVRNFPFVPTISPYPDPRQSLTQYYMSLSKLHPPIHAPVYPYIGRRDPAGEDLSLSPGDEHRGHTFENSDQFYSKPILGHLHRSPVSASSTGGSPNSSFPSPASSSSEDNKLSPQVPPASSSSVPIPFPRFALFPSLAAPLLRESSSLNDFSAPPTNLHPSVSGAMGGVFSRRPQVAGTQSCFPGLSTSSSRQRDPNKPPPVKKYKCDVCGKAFSRSNTLVTHKRIHTGDKPFKCDMCGRAFRQPGNLTRHKLTHTTVKPYVCGTCNKAFNRASNLHTHMRTHTSYKPFVCQYCGKGFHQKIDMKIHSYTHTGEKPHKCKVCGRGFKQLTHLTYHLRTHSEVKMYHCDVCGKGFNQKGNLQAHVYGHTGERPHKCDCCGKSFTLASTLNTHRRTHADKKPHDSEMTENAEVFRTCTRLGFLPSGGLSH